jgi:proline iminopeptidase
VNADQTFIAPESSGHIEVAGGRVWYRSNGDRHRTRAPLLVIHGGPGAPHDYLLPLLAMSGERRVVFYDQLDTGRADRPGDPKNWTVERFVDEVERVRGALGLTELHILGNSWGGTIAAEYAMRRPGGLKSLVLAGPLLNTQRWIADNAEYVHALPKRAREALERSGGQGTEQDNEVAAAIAAFNKRHLCRLDVWPDYLQAAMNAHNTVLYNYMWGPAEFVCTGTLKDYDCVGRLREILAPTLFICGEFDESNPATARQFGRKMKGAQLAVIPNASHLAHIENPDVYLPMLRTFLREWD